LPKLKPVAPRKLVKVMQELGFHQTRITGSHHRFVHEDGRRATVPIHGNEPLGTGLLLKIIKEDLRMTRKEFLKYL